MKKFNVEYYEDGCFTKLEVPFEVGGTLAETFNNFFEEFSKLAYAKGNGNENYNIVNVTEVED